MPNGFTAWQQIDGSRSANSLWPIADRKSEEIDLPLVML
jgi:hypothetical protein